MKIAVLTLDFHPHTGGVQRYLYETLRRLGRNHEITIITPMAGADEVEPFRRVVAPWPRLDLWMRALVAAKPDLVLVGHAHPRLLLVASLIVPRRYGAIVHGNDYLSAQSRWHRPLFNALLRWAHPLITVSRENVQRLHNLGIHQAHIVYPGTDPARFTPADPAPPLPWTLLTVGRLVPRKGVDRVIKALPALMADFPDLRYRVAGEGPQRSHLEQLSRELQVAHHVEFLGRAPDEALPDAYRSAHIFVMPAREVAETASVEGFGIVYLEASACGLPVVAGRSGGAVEAVREGETGFLVAPDDDDALVQALRQLLGSPQLRQQMGQAGRRWVVETMNWDHTAAELARLVEKER